MTILLIVVSGLALVEAIAFWFLAVHQSDQWDRIENLRAGLDGPWRCQEDADYAGYLLAQDEEVMAA